MSYLPTKYHPFARRLKELGDTVRSGDPKLYREPYESVRAKYFTCIGKDKNIDMNLAFLLLKCDPDSSKQLLPEIIPNFMVINLENGTRVDGKPRGSDYGDYQGLLHEFADKKSVCDAFDYLEALYRYHRSRGSLERVDVSSRARRTSSLIYQFIQNAMYWPAKHAKSMLACARVFGVEIDPIEKIRAKRFHRFLEEIIFKDFRCEV